MNGTFHVRTFKYGNGVAIRLPKALGINVGSVFAIERRGDCMVLMLVKEPESGTPAIN
jgi:virulence-associated protein VagC